LKYRLADLQQKYDRTELPMLERPLDIAKGRFTLGDEVVAFSPDMPADTLVFVRGNGVAPVGDDWKKGRRGGTFRGRITFVDARSGDVLAMIEFSSAGMEGWDGTGSGLVQTIEEGLVASSPNSVYDLLGPHPPPPQRK